MSSIPNTAPAETVTPPALPTLGAGVHYDDDWREHPAVTLHRHGLPMPNCRGGQCCRRSPCDQCHALNEWLELTYHDEEMYAIDLRRLRGLLRAYPDEVRELLAPIICDICDAYMEDS